MQDEIKAGGGTAFVSTEDEQPGHVGVAIQDWTQFTAALSIPVADVRALAALLLKHADRAEAKS